MGSKEVQHALATADLFYQAAMGQGDWIDAITSLIRTQNAAGGALFNADRETGEISNWHFVDLNDTDQYLAEMNAINPRMHYSLAQNGPHVLADRHVITSEGMACHEFYRWLENTCDLQQFIGARVRDHGPVSTFMSVEYPAGSAAPEAALVERFSLLTKHLDNALQLTQGRDEKCAADHLDGYLATQTGTALLFFDSQMKFAFANPAGEKLLISSGALSVSTGTVRLRDRTAQAALDRQFEQVRLGSGKISLRPFPLVHVAGQALRRPMLVRLVKLPHALRGSGGKTCSICLFVQQLGSGGKGLRDALTDVFDLTIREAELVEAIRRHHTISAAADSIEMAANTGRVHMQHIFSKLKIRSQIELTQLTDALLNWTPSD